MYRFTRWTSFIILSVVCYAVLAGICQSLTSVALRSLNHEFDQRLPELAALFGSSLAVFPFTGRLLAWTLPLDGRPAAVSTLSTLAVICALIPVETLPYHVLYSASIRCILAAVGCGLMVAGSRLRFRFPA